MTRFLYLSNARLPSVMAHGLQIMQNCEAFADTGADVALWCPRRIPPPTERHLNRDVWAHYGVKRNFKIRRLPCLDLMWLPMGGLKPLMTLLFFVQYGSFALIAMLLALFVGADVYYSRDPVILLLLSLVKPRQQLAYEAHVLVKSKLGAWMQRQVVRRCGLTVAITPPLAERLRESAHPAEPKIIVAHDGIRRERFTHQPLSREAARQQIGWSHEAFIVGYVGRLQTLGMDKGLDTLIDALAALQGSASLAIVGGPAELVEGYRQRWKQHGLPDSGFLYAGQVPPDEVPRYLSAFDACVLPLPWTEHFAYYASPIKLFEYMASQRAMIASALPSWADVLTDGEHALLVPPSDPTALGWAIAKLYSDPYLRGRLADAAYARVMQVYTWDARAKLILAALTNASPKSASQTG